MIELMDIVSSGLVPAEYARPLDERMRALAEITRTVAGRHGAMLVEMRGHPASADPTVYSSDRLHLNARGHAIVAAEAVRVLRSALEIRAGVVKPVPSDAAEPFKFEISQEEILEDLSWPNPPPGQWRIEPPHEADTGQIEARESIERRRPPRRAA
jgi:hypothetical protein